MTATFDFSDLTSDELLEITWVAADFPPIVDLMADIARCHPSGPGLDRVDWSDCYGWTVLNQSQIGQLVQNFFQALWPAISSKLTGDSSQIAWQRPVSQPGVVLMRATKLFCLRINRGTITKEVWRIFLWLHRRRLPFLLYPHGERVW